jgi:hypothetical protein
MNLNAHSLPADILGGYRILGRLGQGAMADVYDAEDSTGHSVALKVFRAGGGMSYTMLERFRREAEATKKLRRHPYILTVYATGNEGDYHYIAMERVDDSRSLEALVGKKAPVELLVNIAIKISSALQYAHEHQIIHRDVKPSNILLDEFNEPMLADFGVAELMDWPTLTLSGTLTGTPMYMSPEQARGEEVSPASDVYSLAVVLYEALTGRIPYEIPENPSTPTILDAVKRLPPMHPRKADPRISRDLAYVLLRALKKDPAERYATAREFGHDLECVMEGKPVAGRWVSPWTSARFWAIRNRNALFAALTLLVFSGVVAAAVRERLQQSQQQLLIFRAIKTSLEVREAIATKNISEPAVRSARSAMRAGRWVEARDLLQYAVSINRDLNLIMPLTDAQLELARAEMMLHNSLRALELYREVWEREQAELLMRQIAAFEGGILLILDGRASEARQVMGRMEALQPGPYPQMLAVALNEPFPENWGTQREEWQSRLRSKALISEVIRHRITQERSALVRRLDEIIRESHNPMEWPIPMAAYLRGRL